MNPFDRRDPCNHLYYDELGAVLPVNGSSYGSTTITVCGLDRPSLTVARVQQARTAHRLADELLIATANGSNHDFFTAILDIHEAGRDEYQFAGVVRSIIKQDCDLTWKDIEGLASEANLLFNN